MSEQLVQVLTMYSGQNAGQRYGRTPPTGTGYPTPVTPGNIQWYGRQRVQNPQNPAQFGTVHSTSFTERQPDGTTLEVLVPTIYDGQWHTPQQALERYHQTREHMGKFRSEAEATAYSKRYSADASRFNPR